MRFFQVKKKPNIILLHACFKTIKKKPRKKIYTRYSMDSIYVVYTHSLVMHILLKGMQGVSKFKNKISK